LAAVYTLGLLIIWRWLTFFVLFVVQAVGGGLYWRKETVRAGGAASHPLGTQHRNNSAAGCTSLWLRRSRMYERYVTSSGKVGQVHGPVLTRGPGGTFSGTDSRARGARAPHFYKWLGHVSRVHVDTFVIRRTANN